MNGISMHRQRAHAGRRFGWALATVLLAGIVTPGPIGVPSASAAPVVGASIPVTQSFGTAVDEVRNRLYVTNITPPQILAFDTDTGALVGSRSIASSPTTVEVNDVTGNVYVAHQGVGDRVSVLDSTLTSLTELALTNPWGPAVNTVTNRVYVANTYGGDVWVVDGATNAVLTTINLAGTSTLGVATDEGRNRIYAADRYSNELYVIDGATNTVSNTLTTGNYPAWVAVDEGLNAVYVSNTNDGTISVFDANTLTLVNSIYVGSQPSKIAVNDVIHRAYVSLQGSARVAVIDTLTNMVVDEVVVPAGAPYQLAVDESASRVFVPTYSGGNVLVVDDVLPPVTQLLGSAGLATFQSLTSGQQLSTINFDGVGLSDGQTISTQYSALGVTFTGLSARQTNSFTHSPPFGAQQSGYNTPGFTGDFTIDFVDPVASVGLYFNDNEANTKVRVYLANSDEAALGVPRPVAAGGGLSTFYGFGTAGNDITRIEVDSPGDLFIVDDLTLGRVVGPPPGDGDGVDTAVEDNAPNGGDGNSDGTLDSAQPHVASLPSATGAGYVTLVSPVGTSLAAVASQIVPANPVPPAGFQFPAGLLAFEVNGLSVGATIQIDVILPAGSSPESVVKLVGGAYLPAPGATVVGNVVTLALQDGDAFDGDGVANGTIVDPAGFGEADAVGTTTSVSSSLNPAAFGAAVEFTATVAAVSGPAVPTGAVTFSIGGIAQAPVSLVNGAATLTVSTLAVGSHVVTAAYAPADQAFIASDSAAAPVSQVVEPGPLASISLNPASAVIGTNTPQLFTVAGFDAFGNPVVDQTANAAFSISPNGACTLNSCRATATGIKVVTATVGSLTATATLDVRARQTISFPTISAKTMLQSPVSVGASASSGLQVSFTTSTPAVCTSAGVNGSSITLLGPGTCTVIADQAGTATWAPAVPVSRSFAVSKATQAITFAAQSAKSITQSPVAVTATASSGLPVTFTTTTPAVCVATGPDGSSIVLLDAGTCRVQADQPGTAAYNAAPSVSRNFTVSKLANTITFPGISGKTLAQTPVIAAATSSSGLPVTFTTSTPAVCTVSGGTVDLVAAGTCSVRADQAGDGVYAAANPVTRNFAVSKVAQAITFAAIGTRNTSQSPITVSASASSGLSVVFSTTTPAVCTAGGVNGSSITLITVGTCTVRAEQPGDAYWRAATAVNRNFNVTLPPPAVQSFVASATVLGAGGGTIELAAVATDAATCRFSVTPAIAGLPLTVPCTAGSALANVTLPANATASSRYYTFNLSALRPGATTAVATPVVVRVVSPTEPVADIAVAGTESFDPAFAGEDLTYAFTVSNAGPGVATDVGFTASLPSGSTFVSAVPTQGASCVEVAAVVTCALGAVALAGTAGVTIVVVPNNGGGGSITVDITTTAFDANPGDNTSQLATDFMESPIVYTDDQTGTVFAMQPSQSPVALSTTTGGKSDAVISPDKRTVAFWRQGPAPTYESEIWMVGLDGSNERFVADVGQSTVPRVSWSPDSSKIVFSVLTGGRWKATVASAQGAPNPQLLIPDMTYGENSPAYSPDGSSIIFRDSCQRPSPAQCRFHSVSSDGTGTPVAYTTYPTGSGGVVWDPAGQWFYFVSGYSTIYRGRVDGSLAEPIATNAYGGSYWSLSPQGDRIAYTELVAGKNVISVIDVDGSNHHQLTTAFNAADPAGCYSPVWTRDQTSVVMHCYPGSGAIGIYRVSSTAPAPTSPQYIGGSFRSRNPDLAGMRPTY